MNIIFLNAQVKFSFQVQQYTEIRGVVQMRFLFDRIKTITMDLLTLK
jgi:hypothetical protein